MLIYGFLITIVGMGAVFAFLLVLMWVIQLMSCFLQKKTDDLSPVAAVIAIALNKGEGK